MKQYQLPKEFATKWVEALRSGEYKQTTKATMEYNGCYCVWGVAAKVFKIPTLSKNTYSLLHQAANLEMSISGLANELFVAIYTLNDIECKTFPEIADWIEQNVEFI